MQKIVRNLALVFIVLFILMESVYCDGTSSQELIENSKAYDNKTVTYEGEVIGDIMRRGSYTWINVSDGNNALGIWLPAEQAGKIKYVGNYKYTGDTVRVSGVFHRACGEHGGDLDIHAAALEIISTGERQSMPVDKGRLLWSLVLLPAAVALMVVSRKKGI